MQKVILPTYRKLPLRGLLRRLPLPEKMRRLEREVLQEEDSQSVKVPAAVAAVGVAPHRAVQAAEEVLFQRGAPAAVVEAVPPRELTVELRVAYLLSLPAHRVKKATVLSYRTKQLQ